MRCELGSQLRPHIVWFGEPVPMFEEAASLVSTADRLIVVGTSLQVYPAAGLVHYAPQESPIHLIDPGAVEMHRRGVEVLKEKASLGMPQTGFTAS
jgi:NAD-dependent deacetylase